MKRFMFGRIGCATLLMGVAGIQLGGCGSTSTKAPPSSPAPRRALVPSAGGLPDLALSEGDGADGFKTMNRGLASAEAVWHVRSALNVAALACNDRNIVSDYNAMLKRQKGVLANAYQTESRRFGTAVALDAHMTKLYNFFAQPPVQREFCTAASRVAAGAQSMPPQQFERFAANAIEQIDRPFQNFYRDYRHYQQDLAAWRAAGGGASEQVVPMRHASAGERTFETMAPWRVQLGAFSGVDAARLAWVEIRRRAPGLASFQPHYEPASAKKLVRLQIGPVSDRREALRLCAAAAAAALDCLPVSPG